MLDGEIIADWASGRYCQRNHALKKNHLISLKCDKLSRPLTKSKKSFYYNLKVSLKYIDWTFM